MPTLEFDDLPDIVIYSIMEFLDGVSLSYVSQVNRRLYCFSSDDHLWQLASLHDYRNAVLFREKNLIILAGFWKVAYRRWRFLNECKLSINHLKHIVKQHEIVSPLNTLPKLMSLARLFVLTDGRSLCFYEKCMDSLQKVLAVSTRLLLIFSQTNGFLWALKEKRNLSNDVKVLTEELEGVLRRMSPLSSFLLNTSVGSCNFMVVVSGDSSLQSFLSQMKHESIATLGTTQPVSLNSGVDVNTSIRSSNSSSSTGSSSSGSHSGPLQQTSNRFSQLFRTSNARSFFRQFNFTEPVTAIETNDEYIVEQLNESQLKYKALSENVVKFNDDNVAVSCMVVGRRSSKGTMFLCHSSSKTISGLLRDIQSKDLNSSIFCVNLAGYSRESRDGTQTQLHDALNAFSQHCSREAQPSVHNVEEQVFIFYMNYTKFAERIAAGNNLHTHFPDCSVEIGADPDRALKFIQRLFKTRGVRAIKRSKYKNLPSKLSVVAHVCGPGASDNVDYLFSSTTNAVMQYHLAELNII